MRLILRDDHTIRLLLLGVALTLIYLTILLPLGFWMGARAASGDTYTRWKHALLGPPPQVHELLLVSVDDESQRELNQRWPWDRALFADLVKRITPYAPRLVLLDFVFAGISNPHSDAALAQAIEQGPPTFLAAYLDPEGELMLPESRFLRAGGIPGLINKPVDRDLVIRRLWAALPFPSQIGPLYALEVKTAALASGVSLEEIRRQGPWLLIGKRKVPLEELGELPINYLASEKSLPTIPFWKILQGEARPGEFRNKLVIVGSAREITHDIHPTPLGRMTGMAVGANGILTLMTQRFLKGLPLWATFPLAFLFVVAILQMSFRLPLPSSLLITACLVGLTTGVGFLLRLSDFLTEFFSPIALGAAAWFVGTLYKYLDLLAATLRLQRKVVTDDLTGGLTSQYLRLRIQEELRVSLKLKQPLTLLLLKVAPPSQLLQSQSWEEIRDHFQKLVTCLKKAAPSRSLLGRLGEDRLALLLVNSPLPKARESAAQLLATLQKIGGCEALALACTDQAPIASTEDLIRCAEAAFARGKGKGLLSLKVFDPTQDRTLLGQVAEATPGEGLEVIASELEARNKALEKALSDLKKAHQEMEVAFLEVTKSLVLALETKDAYTAGHLERVSRYATRLSEFLGSPKEEVEAVREAALLHDIGKIGLPDEVLHKVGILTDQEKEIIREHLSIGAKILEPMKFFRPITTLIYHHHERYDGRGYPHGLAGDFIPAGAQIITIADSFDAMTTFRGYNKPLSAEEALLELKRGAGGQFNPVYVEKFIELIRLEGPQLAGHIESEK